MSYNDTVPPEGGGFCAGGSHGGNGGGELVCVNTHAVPPCTINQPHGSCFAPIDPGNSGCNASDISGGRGGGTVQINVQGEMMLNGSIVADGGGGDLTAAGGAGGSIWIVAQSFFGNGKLSANGGATSNTAIVPMFGGGGMRSPMCDLYIHSLLFSNPLFLIDVQGEVG
jgi:hypothetical protein